jgi:hypothetical protein
MMAPYFLRKFWLELPRIHAKKDHATLDRPSIVAPEVRAVILPPRWPMCAVANGSQGFKQHEPFHVARRAGAAGTFAASDR